MRSEYLSDYHFSARYAVRGSDRFDGEYEAAPWFLSIGTSLEYDSYSVTDLIGLNFGSSDTTVHFSSFSARAQPGLSEISPTTGTGVAV